jgi:hypothetical protein
MRLLFFQSDLADTHTDKLIEMIAMWTLTSARMRRRVCATQGERPRSKNGGDPERGLVPISSVAPTGSAGLPAVAVSRYPASGSLKGEAHDHGV